MEIPRAEAESLSALADACVACGLCLPHCPTYADARQEAESPRGRIMIARALVGGKLGVDEVVASATIDHCLGCRACEAACPAKVDYGQLLQTLRTTLRRARGAPWRQRMVEAVVGSPRWLRMALGLARRLRPLPGLRRRIPAVPDIRPTTPPRAAEPCRGRVLLLPGCVGSAFDAPALAVAQRLLATLGWQVLAGPAYTCCGSLHAHGGDAASAERLTRRLAAAIDAAAADQVLIASSGCIEAVRAAAGGVPVDELCDFLDRSPGWERLSLRSAARRVGVHVACTQRNVVRRPAASGNLLRRIPGIELVEAPESGCCGAAGVQRLRFPEQAAQRVGPLRAWAGSVKLDVLCSSNVGCRLHLQLSLTDLPMVVLHPLELLGDHLP